MEHYGYIWIGNSVQEIVSEIKKGDKSNYLLFPIHPNNWTYPLFLFF
jgi:hypothetical protein